MKKSWILILAAMAPLVSGAAACGDLVSLENRDCPCTTGWTCCVEQNVCVASGTTCTKPLPSPDTGIADAPSSDVAKVFPGNSWCASHVDSLTLFCEDFDDVSINDLGTLGGNPPGPWDTKQRLGATSDFNRTTFMPNSAPASLEVMAVPTDPNGYSLDQYVTTKISPTGVILSFDLHVENYSAATRDLSIARIAVHAATLTAAPWWVSWDFNANTGQLAEFGSDSSAATLVDSHHTNVPDFTYAGFYHVTFALDLVLGNVWWTFSPASSTILSVLDAGNDAASVDGGGSDDAGADGTCGNPFPLLSSPTYAAKFPSSYDQFISQSTGQFDIVIGENYGTELCDETDLFFDNVRVEAVPAAGLPNGPTFPLDDGGM